MQERKNLEPKKKKKKNEERVKEQIGFVYFLFNGISAFVNYSMPNISW